MIGAGAPLGLEIARIAAARGARVTAAYRTARPGVEDAIAAAGARPARLDLGDQGALAALLKDADGAILTPILTASVLAAGLLAPNQRAVFFSSNNVAIDPQAEVYARLLECERKVQAAAPRSVILRPTMIYGYPGDGNLSRLMAAMRRRPAMPMPGGGAALQQPVYYKDLARAALDALEKAEMAGAVRAVAGPDRAPKRGLYKAVAAAAGVSPWLIPLPTAPLARLAGALERMGLRLPLSAAQLRRAGLDKTPRGADPIITETPLREALGRLVEDGAIKDRNP